MPPPFQNVVDEHYQNLYRFALSLCRSADDAWDLTQEAFLKWGKKGAATLRSDRAVKSWLYTTLYRDFLKLAKRRQRWSSLEQKEEETHFELASPQPDWERLDAEQVMARLAELKLEYRKVVTLYFLESYSYKEISQILQVPIGTVMSRLARGKAMLRKKCARNDNASNLVDFKSNEGKTQHG